MTIATDLERAQLVIELQHLKIADLSAALATTSETMQKAEARVKHLDERVAQLHDLLEHERRVVNSLIYGNNPR